MNDEERIKARGKELSTWSEPELVLKIIGLERDLEGAKEMGRFHDGMYKTTLGRSQAQDRTIRLIEQMIPHLK